ncbi:MAG: RsmF rRNA methyltransferase first C-terminal domain-containing protein, partial [Vallitaleaceae bacterium]|nr:RsmF rRNA methyltransferase first C-terminal domain-containing protein [Vallitaleaceae bacterium]
MRLPIEFEKAMRDLLKDEYSAYEKSLDQPYFGGLRGNELKVDGKRLQEIVPFQLEAIPWVHNGFYFLSGEQPAKDPYYHAGLYYIQEPSAMTPASILPVSPGDKILDLCAAPGGKSTQLGAKLGNTGLLVCNDISPSRAKAIVKNIEIFGIKNALVLSESPKKLQSYFEGFFDKVLVDAPCSGEGMFRKDPSMIKNWEEMGVAPYVALQEEILPSADKMLKPGGTMVYSTCTFSLEENERMISWFMESYPNYELIKIPVEHGFSEGREGLTEAIRLFPHKLKGEGHFVVLLHKKAAQASETPKVNAFEPPSAAQLVDFKHFEETYLNFAFDRNQLMLLEDHLYSLPKELPSLKGLRVLKSGWALGEMKKNRFEPSQAFASG